MKISLDWLKEFIDLTLSPEEIASILTSTGLEVESFEKLEIVKGGLNGVVIGEVVSCKKHHDADKLKITEVFIGYETLQIVCGAPNVSKNQKVLVATVGSTLYPSPDAPFSIKKSKIRGVESNGMICAEDELGVGNDHNGIMVLPNDVIPGTKASEYFNFSSDYIFEIGLTPNRSDALGHLGVARDIAAYLTYHNKEAVSLKKPPITSLNSIINNNKLKVEVIDSNCLRYMGIRVSNVSILPSPEWLQQRLRSIGVAPINNVVDITNFVMRELGTPLHAFDSKVIGNHIVVRTAKNNEKLTTLDKQNRIFNGTEMLICSDKSAACIAGVMGGIESGVSNETKEIFLESAVFDMVSIRKTARLHGINSDASFRFERGVDRSLTEMALLRACYLILEIAGGQISSELIDIQKEKINEKYISFNPEEINQLLGTTISHDDIEKILISLDFVITKDKNDWNVKIPIYRIDVERVCDIAEEVLRIYGFNNVEVPEKMAISIQEQKGIDEFKVRGIISEFLVSKGFAEAMNNSLSKKDYYNKLLFYQESKDQAVKLLNPLSQDLEILRQSLIPGLLENISFNQNRQSNDLKLFEYGNTYHRISNDYRENNWLTIVMTGKKHEENWINNSNLTDFFYVKGIAENLMSRLGFLNKLEFINAEDSHFSSCLSGVFLRNEILKIGQLSLDYQKYFDLKNTVFVININWKNLIDALNTIRITFKELPKSFVVRRDFSLLLDKKIEFSEIQSIAKKTEKNILKKVNLFDVYEGEKLEKNKKSYAVSFHFQDGDKTLKDNEVDSIMEKIRSALEKQLGAQLR